MSGLRHQVKIKNIYIYFFKIIKQNMETSLRTGFAQIFSCYAKNLSCPKFGGTAALLAPPPTLPLYLIEKCFPRIQSFQKCSYTKSTRTHFVLVRPRKFVFCPAVINYTQKLYNGKRTKLLTTIIIRHSERSIVLYIRHTRWYPRTVVSVAVFTVTIPKFIEIAAAYRYIMVL